jgi:hypothetical protein
MRQLGFSDVSAGSFRMASTAVRLLGWFAGQGYSGADVHRITHETIRPQMTNFLGGSNGAGVPFSMNTNVNMHHSAIAVPSATMIMSTTCDAPVVAGDATPDHDKNRGGK